MKSTWVIGAPVFWNRIEKSATPSPLTSPSARKVAPELVTRSSPATLQALLPMKLNAWSPPAIMLASTALSTTCRLRLLEDLDRVHRPVDRGLVVVEAVGTDAATHQVGAGAALELIVAVAGPDDVVARAAERYVIAIAAVELVGADVAVQDVVAVIADQHVVAGDLQQGVGATAAAHGVVAVPKAFTTTLAEVDEASMKLLSSLPTRLATLVPT